MPESLKFLDLWGIFSVDFLEWSIFQSPALLVLVNPEEEFFEFSLHVEPLTEEVALIITDFVDADEEGDAIELWNKQVEMLHRTVGG